MPPKRAPKRKAHAKKRTQRGGMALRSHMVMHPRDGTGFFSDIWDGVKGVANFVKDNKLISKGLSLIPHPYGQIGSQVASQIGVGKGRKRRTIKYT